MAPEGNLNQAIKYIKEYFTNLINKLFLGTCCVSQHHVNNNSRKEQNTLFSETPSAAMVWVGWEPFRELFKKNEFFQIDSEIGFCYKSWLTC